MNQQSLNVAVVGLGFMGNNHLRVYSEMEGVNLVAVAESDEERLSRAVRGRTIRPYTDYREMLEKEALDAVSIVVPTSLHRDVALAAIESGVGALIEKPIGRNVEEGIEIQEAAQRLGVVVAVGHIERFNPAVGEFKRRLKDNTLGTLYQVQARRIGPFQQRLRDVGVVHDLATHDIDVMRFVLGAEVSRLHAVTRTGIRTEFEDTLFAILEFDNGVVGLLDINWLSPVKVRELRLVGERGMLSLDYVSQEVRYYQGDLPAAQVEHASAIPDSDGINMLKREPLREELEAFVKSVAQGEQPLVGCKDAIVALDLAGKLVQSARSGKAVDVESPLG